MKGRFAVALATFAGAVLLSVPAALGADVTKTLSFPLSGSSSTNIFLLGPYECCGVSVFDQDLGNISEVTLSLDMGTALSSPTHSDLTFTDTNLRQGRTLDMTNTYSRDPGGKLDVSYTLAFHANVYGFVVDPSKTVGDTLDCSVPLLTQQCQHTQDIGLFDITVLDIGVGSVKVHFSVPITTKADIDSNGVSSVRTMSVAGAGILGPGTLTFASDPSVKDESTALSCALPAGEPVNYAMETATSEVNGGVTENVGLAVSVVGSPIVEGSGPGGSLSPCGDSSLDIHWKFDDGGSAFGKTINHAFPDNFLGASPPHTGKVVITDPTGLSTTLNFSVPVANIAPTVNAGPNKTALWGVPVSFHANGADAGPVDNGILLYNWDFGDPASPIGASGQDASHVYSMPSASGTPYTTTATVMDNDGATASNTVQVTVLKRGTTTAYTGPINSNSSKTVSLTASLVDELNQPVNNGTILFTLGTQSVSAQTNASGLATATIKLSQKHGTYTVTASFAGSDKYTLSSNSQTFTIGP